MRQKRLLGLAVVAAMALMAAHGAGTASATELYQKTVANHTQGVNSVIEASLKSGTSLILRDTFGFSVNTCTGSAISSKIEKAGGEASHPSGKVSTLTFSGCNGTFDVLANGELDFKYIAGTTNGTVTSNGLELQLSSAIHKTNIVCKTGTGTFLGTLTGALEEDHATIDINATINCGPHLTSGKLTGTYVVTSPTGLIVEEAPNSGTELYQSTEEIANHTQGVNSVIEASLKSGTSLILRDTFGFTANTCTGSAISSKIEKAGGEASHPSGKVSTLTFSGCNGTFDVLANGELEFQHKAGTTNAFVVSKEMELSVLSEFHNTNIVCKTGTATILGTLTGALKEGHATIDINAVLTCAPHLHSAKLTGTYTITTPTGLIAKAS